MLDREPSETRSRTRARVKISPALSLFTGASLITRQFTTQRIDFTFLLSFSFQDARTASGPRGWERTRSTCYIDTCTCDYSKGADRLNRRRTINDVIRKSIHCVNSCSSRFGARSRAHPRGKKKKKHKNAVRHISFKIEEKKNHSRPSKDSFILRSEEFFRQPVDAR